MNNKPWYENNLLKKNDLLTENRKDYKSLDSAINTGIEELAGLKIKEIELLKASGYNYRNMTDSERLKALEKIDINLAEKIRDVEKEIDIAKIEKEKLLTLNKLKNSIFNAFDKLHEVDKKEVLEELKNRLSK